METRESNLWRCKPADHVSKIEEGGGWKGDSAALDSDETCILRAALDGPLGSKWR